MAPLVRTGGSRHTGLAALPHRNIHVIFPHKDKKKDIINRICRHRHENYANRYTELYRCFREINHIDLEARCEGYNLKQTKKKDKLSVIRYAEQFGHIDDLYSCCVKLYESEVKAIIEQLNELQN